MRTEAIETITHGRVLVRDAPDAAGLVVAFHGYAQAADDVMSEMERVPGIGRWRIVAPQALHRFYIRGDQRVVASWMTRQDRELAIADNVAYVERAIEAVGAVPGQPVVFAGFSQGASMAYRSAVLGRTAAAGIVALGGDVPPEVREHAASATWPPVLIGVGSREHWYTSDKLDRDLDVLRRVGASVETVRFDGGHEWTDEFRRAAGRWLAGIAGT